MSLAGFMKQINKANQLISEKIGGAKVVTHFVDLKKLKKENLIFLNILRALNLIIVFMIWKK